MCECCDEAREAPQQHQMFADGCLYCAARRIQYLQRTLRLGESATRDRCRAALAQAMALGLPEVEIRRMAKLPEWQVEPEQKAEPARAPVQRKRGR